jgi:hypothetical protein
MGVSNLEDYGAEKRSKIRTELREIIKLLTRELVCLKLVLKFDHYLNGDFQNMNLQHYHYTNLLSCSGT